MIAYQWVVLACSLVACSVASPFTKCTDAMSGTINSLSVTGCADGSEACVLKRGTNVSISIDFSNTEDSATVTAKAWGMIAGIPIPYPLPQPDGCQGSGITCPIAPNNKYTYNGEFEVKTLYPAISLNVKWVLADANSNDIICAMIPVKIE